MPMRTDGVSRRDVLRSAGLLTAAGAVAAVAGIWDPAKADAATPSYQSNWRYCSACACLKYGNGSTFEDDCCLYNAGAGVGNGTHNSGSRNYYLYTSASGVSGQSGWRWCTQCSEIFWPAAGSHCPLTFDAHTAAGYTYVMLNTGTTNPNAGQSGWRYCVKCHALIWPGNRHHWQCAGGGDGEYHSVTGYDYIMPYY